MDLLKKHRITLISSNFLEIPVVECVYIRSYYFKLVKIRGIHFTTCL